MCMKYELFERYIKDILKQREFEDNLYSAYKNIGGNCEYFNPVTDIAVDLISKEFNDEKDSLIAYWLWELDAGKEWKPGYVRDNNGNDIKLETISDLYDALIKQMVEREEENDTV